jgi:hypothetical protein
VKPIVFSQDIKATVKNNNVLFASTVDQPQSVNQHTTTIAPVQIYTQLDINSKEFWELVKRAAVELRLNTSNITKQEHAMVASKIAIAIQNTMDE